MSNLLKSPTKINEITAQHSTAQSLIKPKFRAFILPALLLFGSCLIQLRADDQLSNLEATITYSESAEASAYEAAIAADAAQVYANNVSEASNNSAANIIDNYSEQAMAQFLADADAAQAAQIEADLALQASAEAHAAAEAAAQAAANAQVAADTQTIVDALATAEASALEAAMAAADAQAAAEAAAAFASYDWAAEQNAISNAATELLNAQNEAGRLQALADAEASAAMTFAYEQMQRENQAAYQAQLDALYQGPVNAATFASDNSYVTPETSAPYTDTTDANLLDTTSQLGIPLIIVDTGISQSTADSDPFGDWDNDQLTNFDERYVHNTDPENWDTNGNGRSDYDDLYNTIQFEFDDLNDHVAATGQLDGWDFFSIVDIDLVPLVGIGISFGWVLDFDHPLDSGYYFNWTLQGGANVGVAAGFGLAPRDIEGTGGELDLNVPPNPVTLLPISVTGITDDQGFNGIGITVGPGSGASAGAGETSTWTPLNWTD